MRPSSQPRPDAALVAVTNLPDERERRALEALTGDQLAGLAEARPDLVAAIAEVHDGVRGAHAANTSRSYGYAWRTFTDWWADAGPRELIGIYFDLGVGDVDPDPLRLSPAIAAAAVQLYLGWLAATGGRDGNGRRPNTWDVHLAAIKAAFNDRRGFDPTKVADARFARQLKGMRKNHRAGEVEKAPALLLDELMRIHDALEVRRRARLREAVVVALHGAGVSPATVARCRLETTRVAEDGTVALRPDGGRIDQVVLAPMGRPGCAAKRLADWLATTPSPGGASTVGPLIAPPATSGELPDAYRRHHARYLRWRAEQDADTPSGRDLEPAGLVDRWIAELRDERGLAASTLTQYRRAVTAALTPQKTPPPAPASVQHLTSIITRHHRAATGTATPRGRLPAWDDAAQVDAAVAAALRPTLQDLRDWSIVCTGWHLAQRRSNLYLLNWEDLTPATGSAGSGVEVRLTRSKTDQEGRGRTVGLVDLGDGLEHVDGVAALTHYRDALEAHVGPLDGRWPVYVKLNAAGTAPAQPMPDLDAAVDGIHGRRARLEAAQTARDEVALSGQGIAEVVDRLARLAGLGTEPHTGRRRRYTGHSLRRGWITWAVQSGMTLEQVMAHSGHESVETAYEYADAANALSDKATAARAADHIRRQIA